MEFFGQLASFVMGLILGTMGGGGSILTVPIMVYLFGISPTIATGYSLFVVGIAALIGGAMYVVRGEVDFKTGLWFAVPSVAGVTISRGLILPKLPDEIARFAGFVLTKDVLVMAVFAALMVAASYSMIRRKKTKTPSPGAPAARAFLIAAQGLVVGLMAGFVGAGGGFLIIPALVLLAGLSMRVAVGTSLMIIAFQSLLGFAGDISRGVNVNWGFLSLVAAIAALGIIAGSYFADRIHEQKLKMTFGWFVLLMGVAILLEQTRHI